MLSEKLFVQNLFECCGYKEYNDKDFFDDLTDKVVHRIEQEISIAKHTINKLCKSEGSPSALPKSFIEYVHKNRELRAKAGDYTLYQLCKKIINANDVLATQKSCNGEEKEIIDNFCKILENNSYAKLFSQPKRIMGLSKIYTTGQKKVISFLLREIIPQYEFGEKKLCDVLLDRYQTWDRLILYRGTSQTPVLAIRQIEADEAEIRAKFEKYYDELNASSNVGKTLEDMFDSLIEYSQRNSFISAECIKQMAQDSYDGSQVKAGEDTEASDYDAYISTEILNFMRWLPMVENNWEPNLGYLESIERIIGKIRSNYIEFVKREQRDSKSKDSERKPCVFMLENGIPLRKELICAMNDETLICTLFRDYYCQAGGTKQ